MRLPAKLAVLLWEKSPGFDIINLDGGSYGNKI